MKERVVWNMSPQPDETVMKHYNDLCNELLALEPIIVEAPASFVPVVSLSDKFEGSGDIPLKGEYVCGKLNGVPIRIIPNLEDTIRVIRVGNIGIEPFFIEVCL